MSGEVCAWSLVKRRELLLALGLRASEGSRFSGLFT